jgi:hypothetical protein
MCVGETAGNKGVCANETKVFGWRLIENENLFQIRSLSKHK